MFSHSMDNQWELYSSPSPCPCQSACIFVVKTQVGFSQAYCLLCPQNPCVTAAGCSLVFGKGHTWDGGMSRLTTAEDQNEEQLWKTGKC